MKEQSLKEAITIVKLLHLPFLDSSLHKETTKVSRSERILTIHDMMHDMNSRTVILPPSKTASRILISKQIEWTLFYMSPWESAKLTPKHGMW